MDVVSTDYYPDFADPQTHVEAALSRRHRRAGSPAARPWLLMETSPSAVNWQPRNPAKRPGQLRPRRAAAGRARSRRLQRVPGPRLARRRGEVPLRADPPRRHRHAAVARGRRARRAPRPARRGRGQPRRRGGRDRLGLAVVVGAWSSTATRRSTSPTPTGSRLPPRAVGPRHRGRRRRAGRPARGLPARGRAHPLPRGRRRGAGARRRTSADGGHAVVTYFSGIVDERRPHPDRRIPRRVPRPARRPRRGVRAAARGRPRHPRRRRYRRRLDRGPAPRRRRGRRALRRRPAARCTPRSPGTRYGDGVAWYVATRTDAPPRRGSSSGSSTEAGVAPVAASTPGRRGAAPARGEASWLFVLNHTDERWPRSRRTAPIS